MKLKKLTGVILAVLMMFSMIPLSAYAYSAEQALLTFSDSGITETTPGTGYTIDGTSLAITAAGTYRLTGSCSEGTVEVSKGLSNVTLILDNLTLTSSATAPVIVKKTSNVLIKLVGTSTITNSEDPTRETTDPDNYEGAAIKVKSSSTAVFFGDGTLKINGSSKNGIKGGTESTLKFDGGTYNVTAVNNGIAADGNVVINDGTFNVTSDNDGIKAVPDEGDTTSAGTVTINGGTFTINAQGDGIQAAENLTITNGVFDIKTLNGYNSSTFDKDTMSCKGLKASGNNDNETAPTNQLNISGGTFNLNTADDAVHSDGYCTITGGTFTIYTGDDGVHADSTLTLGTENGYERDPVITIKASYEGLEGSVVNAYSGKFYVIASDDGINSAGGSSNGSDPGQGGNDQFRPGGGNRPGQGGFGGQTGQTTSANYSLNIYGGDFYVNCDGDGLDSNGALNLLGGNITVLSMRSGGDNSPIDSDGTVTINGATVFAAGSQGMGLRLSSSQNYYTSTTQRSANTVVNVNVNNSTVYSEKLTKNINYLLYSSPAMTSNSASVTTASSVSSCKSNAWAHNWDNGTIETAATTEHAGVIKYTCSDCGDVERKTIPQLTTVTEYVEGETQATEAATSDPVIYTANFVTDSNATIDVYYTQDYSTPSETNVTSAIARNSDTGESDGTGEGQINFVVNVAEGYKVDSVTVDGNYKNLKDLSLTELIDNLYRITKVAGDLTVTVTTSRLDGTEEEDKGYNVSFVTDDHSSINVYYTQDYTTADETGVTTAVSRNSTSGVPDSTGEGQVNFTVECGDGYEVESVGVEGSYKNLKGPADTLTENTYRITKVSGDIVITVTTKEKSENSTESVTQEPTEQTTTEPQSASTESITTEAPTETQNESQPATDAPTSATDPTASQASTEATEATTSAETTAPASTEAQTSSTESTTSPANTATKAGENTVSGVGKGADYTAVDKLITTSKTEEPAGAEFSKLLARATKVAKKSITLKWKKLSGAQKYIIYANKCGTSNKYKKLATVSSSKNTYKVTKAAGKKLKKGTYYKFLIVAVNSKNKVISTAATLHIATKGGKVGNYKNVTTAAKNNKVTLSKGKTFKLKAKATPQSKKLKVKQHRAIKYESSNKNIATVNSKGKITAKKKGTCYIYVYAQSGTYKRIKVTVK